MNFKYYNALVYIAVSALLMVSLCSCHASPAVLTRGLRGGLNPGDRGGKSEEFILQSFSYLFSELMVIEASIAEDVQRYVSVFTIITCLKSYRLSLGKV